MTLRYVSLFSGIEAASVAWKPLGWEALAFSEIDAFPRAVLSHHYPGVTLHGDMTAVEWSAYCGRADVVVGGSPCQSFSVAGLRKGLDDPRGNLTLAYLAAVARTRPRWVVWENVPGVLSIDGGRVFGAFLRALGELGYGFAYRVLDAQFFGVPQRRRRVFVVGHLGDWRRAAAVLFERASLSWHPAPRREARQAVAGSLGCGSPRSGGRFGQSEAAAGLLIPAMHADVSPALKARDSKGQSSDGDGDGAILVPMVAFDTTQITSKANYSNPQPGDPCHPLAAGAHPPAIAFDARQSDVIQYGDKTGPLDTDGTSIAVQTACAVRRLTPRECERLQGFPDDYTAIVYNGKPAADGPRYKALGNSMAVPVMAWIGRRIAAVDEITSADTGVAA